ncbi:unnamed protein product [Wuchereria bancrofti]|uniref:Condensin II complex subunit H2 N-terminal domain-containing protein n=1 Tax=Wuchereria bancrofti TaxID=6293 RepID=A0A3P7EGF3_WUCBA|nr:unnamed protein product [Wuchereria bancrofti]
MTDEDELSMRYAFLLQPIRDLQKNWDIDISHLLEEFVERLSILDIFYLLLSKDLTMKSMPYLLICKRYDFIIL